MGDCHKIFTKIFQVYVLNSDVLNMIVTKGILGAEMKKNTEKN